MWFVGAGPVVMPLVYFNMFVSSDRNRSSYLSVLVYFFLYFHIRCSVAQYKVECVFVF